MAATHGCDAATGTLNCTDAIIATQPLPQWHDQPPGPGADARIELAIAATGHPLWRPDWPNSVADRPPDNCASGWHNAVLLARMAYAS